MSKRGVIVSGGSLDREFALEQIQKWNPEILIGVDGGLFFFHETQMVPTLMVGDFDSVDEAILEYFRKEKKVPERTFLPEKDATDTELALQIAIEMGAAEICLLGATGTRLDHTLANIQILKMAKEAKVKACILDTYNRISLIEKEISIKKEEAFGNYFSLFPLGGEVPHLAVQGAKYPLRDYTLRACDSRCVSNEWKEDIVKITFPEGDVILMETRDGT